MQRNVISVVSTLFTLLTVARVTADMNMSCDIIMHASRLISIRRRIETNREATAIAHILEYKVLPLKALSKSLLFIVKQKFWNYMYSFILILNGVTYKIDHAGVRGGLYRPPSQNQLSTHRGILCVGIRREAIISWASKKGQVNFSYVSIFCLC